MPDRLRPFRFLNSVRVRITVVATLATGVAVLLAGAWLSNSVETSLTSRLHDAAQARLASVRSALEEGRSLDDLDLAVLAAGAYVQVIANGHVIAATPGMGGLPPLYTLTPRGDVVRLDPSNAVGVPPGSLTLTREQVQGPGGRYSILAASSLETVRRGVDAVEGGLHIALPVLVGAVGLLAWILTGRALRPVEAIRSEVEAITGSTLDRRVPVPRTGDEVTRLALTMNAMLDRLEDAASRQQRFVADASHELRSPVAAIRTELEVAQRTAGPEDWPVVAERLLGEEARLEATISDLLLLASLDEGAGSSEHVPIDLSELVVEEARRRAPDRDGVTLDVDAPRPVLVHGSRTQLQRAVVNLLDNAGRHARATVRLAVHERDDRVRLLVDDDGPGIPEADRERVFERFTRLDEHRTRGRSSGGSGLGLSLVRRIAQLHGGTASVDTAPLGGARLVVDLPVLRT
jgi:signal transduction histidine kinase